MDKESFLEKVKECIESIELYKQNVVKSNPNNTIQLNPNNTIQLNPNNRLIGIIDLLDSIIEQYKQVIEIFSRKKISDNYIQIFDNNLTIITKTILDIQEINNLQGRAICKYRKGLQDCIERIQFNLKFFKKTDFSEDNIVAIGANGSGKTTLADRLDNYLPKDRVVIISAQKIMIIPAFNSIPNHYSTSRRLQETQHKSSKETYGTGNQRCFLNIMDKIGSEFQRLLENLLSKRNLAINKFCDNLKSNPNSKAVPPVTELDKTLDIWNSLIEYKRLKCDGADIIIEDIKSQFDYEAYRMSDGEKVVLYLIAHVLQAPKKGIIIVDEPEVHLHKTILDTVWDRLEKERKDCIFIYLTHDLDYAASRVAKKVWIKSFTPPSEWEIKDIPDNEIPEPLRLKLLGSRKTILFCEGNVGSIDIQLYKILFPNFTITPVETCSQVINYTKTYNKMPDLYANAIGIIDSDHHNKEHLLTLKEKFIYSFKAVEPENLLLDVNVLKGMAKRFYLDPDKSVNKIVEDVLNELKDKSKIQIANYVSTKINDYFSDLHVKKGNDIDKLKKNYSEYLNEIDIDRWAKAREKELEEIISKKDYKRVLFVFNNKGLKRIVKKHLDIGNFSNRALSFLQDTPEICDQLKTSYFPEELLEQHK